MDMMDLARTMQLIRAANEAPALPWLSVLRSHCVTLSEADPELVSAISFTTQLTGGSLAEAQAVRQISKLLADEFGFTASICIEGTDFGFDGDDFRLFAQAVRRARASGHRGSLRDLPRIASPASLYPHNHQTFPHSFGWFVHTRPG